MRILIINESLSQETGGATLYVINVIAELIARGHEISVIHGHKEAIQPAHGAHAYFGLPDIFGFHFQNIPERIAEFKRLVATINPELIYIHQIHNPRIFSYITPRWPVVRFEHGIDLTCPTARRMSHDFKLVCNHKAGWACQYFAFTQHCMPRNPALGLKTISRIKQNLAAHKKMSRVRVASNYVKRLLLRQGISSRKIVILPYFTEIPLTASRCVNWEKPNILFVGRIIAEKGPQFLFEALQKIKKPLTVSVLGSGDLLPRLKAVTQEVGWLHEVRFLDWIDNQKIGVFYESAALIVVPSLIEAFGIIGIEAMAHGVPAVAFDTGGISDWLEHGKTGLLVQRGNSAALAAAIERLAFDKQTNIEWGNQARRIAAEKYGKNLHMQKLEKLFEDIVNQKPAKPE